MVDNLQERAFEAINEYTKELPDEIDKNKFIIWLKNNRPDVYYQDGIKVSDADVDEWINQYNKTANKN